jgi:Icc-related predicted phosphoesterase
MVQTRIFFASDLHGSERVFMKFINAPKYYDADALILGGDVTGKVVIPIVENPNGSYSARFMGQEFTVKSSKELEELSKRIRYTGYYPLVTNQQEAEELSASKEKLNEVFLQLMTETVKSWVNIAEERLKNSGVKCYIMPGNDDRPEIGEILSESSSDQIVNPEGKVVNLDDGHEMISLGLSNITPWNAPRDVPEEVLEEKLEQMTSSVQHMENCVFNLHCPPFDSGLDSAPKLDKDHKPGIDTELTPVGSVAVRQAIDKFQPLLGLHGHIHESRGIRKIGRTICINPGSEYTEGYLRGALVAFDGSKVKTFMLTSG